MNKKLKLSDKERGFLILVSRAIFANPFSDERRVLNIKISGLDVSHSDKELITKVIETVREKLLQFENEGRDNINYFHGEDQELVKRFFLFDFFHSYIHDFDNFIIEQIKNNDESIKVSFAKDAFDFLLKKGFPKDEVIHYFAICYQIRRAFFFIYNNLVGRSESMKRLRKDLWNNIFTNDINLYNNYLVNRMEDFSTLVLGETGTGKGACAMAIGRSGFIPYDETKQAFAESFNKSFVSLNISQFPENLIESELFGHKKGAFTGAVEDYNGVFQHCSKYGSIFLDEIGEVSVPVQIKLLQVFQERLFTPVGSHNKLKFYGRIIAATNQSLERIRKEGRFRDDFYYRLCSDVIYVPPLRERIKEDHQELDDLLDYTIKRIIGNDSKSIKKMVKDVILDKLDYEYSWPGNVRELEQCVRRVLLKKDYDPDIKLQDGNYQSNFINQISNAGINVNQLITGYCNMLYDKYNSYQDVAKITELDWRTVKKYLAH